MRTERSKHWICPVKVLRDFRLSVYFDGSLEPLSLADLAERIAAEPGGVTITHAHAAFTIRQTWIAAFDKPAAVVLLEIDTARPLRLRASFVPEMRPMWPASFGGQNSDFDEKEHALILSKGARELVLGGQRIPALRTLEGWIAKRFPRGRRSRSTRAAFRRRARRAPPAHSTGRN